MFHRHDSANPNPVEIHVNSSGSDQIQIHDEVDNQAYCSLQLNSRVDGHEYTCSQVGLEVRMLASIFVMGFLQQVFMTLYTYMYAINLGQMSLSDSKIGQRTF